LSNTKKIKHPRLKPGKKGLPIKMVVTQARQERQPITARLAKAAGNGFDLKFLFNFKVSSSVES
jgi:uncharacterized FlgJ-related protein